MDKKKKEKNDKKKNEKPIDSIIAGTGKGAERNIAETYVLVHSLNPMIQRLLTNEGAFTEMRILGFVLSMDDIQAIAYALTENKTLRALSLDHLQIGDEGAKQIAQGLCYNESLTYLSMRWNNISDDGGCHLADSLHYNKSLKTFVLSYNCLSDKAGKSFSLALKKHPAIVTLDLKWNQIGDEAGDALLDALSESQSMNSLLLSGNGSTLRNVEKGRKRPSKRSKSMRFLSGISKDKNNIDEGTMSLEQLKQELANAANQMEQNNNSNYYQEEEYVEEYEESRDLMEGDLVEVKGNDGNIRRGRVRFIGETEFADGIWIGVEFETAVGKNDGMVNNVRYFNCPPNHGSFLRPEKIIFIGEE
eukprot:TRINITY_DN49919_c0_g1_i3.p1 TRINITY_DN49919_c0_g1~~TRINITY_DN49919_c0_g1_i3.p1  ORF type:complete len:361 (-),score=84.39 TRINITY_DN49919_c0_g1_i3:125-1207(-)